MVAKETVTEYEISIFVFIEEATRGVLWKKVFLEISQNSQESTHTRVSFLLYVSTISDRFSERNENLSGIVETPFTLFCFITICSDSITHKSYSKINIRV